MADDSEELPQFSKDDRIQKALLKADEMIGKHENNTELRAFLRGENIDPRRAAWCAAFLNSVFKHAGITPPESQMATSYLGWGKKVSKDRLKAGDVIVWGRDRESPREGHLGHVAIVQERQSDKVVIVQGNTSNKVANTLLPLESIQNAEFRRPPASHKNQIRVMTRMIVK